MSGAARVFAGDAEVAGVPADDRGLAYGDGLFETMRAHRDTLPWWARHWSRLADGAARLSLPLPAEALVHAQALRLLGERGGDGVLRLLVTRGGGARGYAPPACPRPTWILSHHPVPPMDGRGLHLRWCATRLAIQPALAGPKHCNRLEQVLARAECSPRGGGNRYDEGLVLAMDGEVAGATSANVLALVDGEWLTPPVSRCGVAGTCRGWLIEQGLAREASLRPGDVEGASALALCNAVRGILAVARLGTHAWAPHPRTAGLQQALGAAHPAFAPPEVP